MSEMLLLLAAKKQTKISLPVTVWIGDSITAATGHLSIADWTEYFIGGRLIHPPGCNQGVGGNTTAQMLARQATGLALNPVVYCILGGTNDLVLGVSTATTIANLTSLINNALATPSCKLVVVRTLLKRNDSTYLGSPAAQAAYAAVNAWIRSINNSKVLVIDYDLCAFDPSIHTSEGLHPNALGAVVLGEYTASRLATRLSNTDPLADTSGNLLTNPTLAGTGGTLVSATGQVADNWQVRNFTGCTCVASKGLDAAGNNTQIVTLNGTASGVPSYLLIRQIVTYAGAAGEVYDAMAKLDISNGTNLGNINSTCDGVLAFGTGDTTLQLNRDMAGVIRPQRTSLSGSDTSNTLLYGVYFAAGVTLTNFTITLSRPCWKKIA